MYQQIITTKDTHTANGQLKVAKGARGYVIGTDRGFATVLFHDEQAAFVKPGHTGRLVQEVPLLHTQNA